MTIMFSAFKPIQHGFVLWRETIWRAASSYNIVCNKIVSNDFLTRHKKCKYLNVFQVRGFHKSNSQWLFWEADEKGGYRKEEKFSKVQLIRSGLKELKEEIKLWKEEVKEKLEDDPILTYRPGEIDYVWQFNQPGSIDKWVTSSDKDHNEGFSTCELATSPSGYALFHGNLCTHVPKDGKIKRAGYCNMKSMRIRKSFKRESYYDWSFYTHIVFRVRGDGRSYMLNLSTTGYFDIMWYDIYHFALYTRGGPYWQTTKIPFSKFFLSSKGRVQDRQHPIPLDKVSNIGITACDTVDGPFHLEIDYIGLEYDPSHTEEFAYEMYKLPKYVAGT